MDKELFIEMTKEVFSFLEDESEFSEPIIKNFGREIFIDFDRGYQTLSISYEIASEPIFEIHNPSDEAGEESVPYLMKDGMPRSRRFPKLERNVVFSSENSATFKKYMEEMASLLQKAEAEWLKNNIL